MKKFFAFILLIISVACSVVPCCMYDGCNDKELTSEAGNHESEEGACSPFFSCTTCSGFAETTKPAQLPSLFIQKQTHHSQAAVFHPSGYEVSFWQPPRFL